MNRKKNIFDKIGSFIPGYTGYSLREGRRNCDKILREEIAVRLSETDKTLYERIAEALNSKNKRLATDIDEIRKEVNTICSRIKYARYGASAFFTESQIKEEELCHIYQIDLDLNEVIEKLKNNASSSTLSEIKNMLGICQEILNRRNSYINEFK